VKLNQKVWIIVDGLVHWGQLSYLGPGEYRVSVPGKGMAHRPRNEVYESWEEARKALASSKLPTYKEGDDVWFTNGLEIHQAEVYCHVDGLLKVTRASDNAIFHLHPERVFPTWESAKEALVDRCKNDLKTVEYLQNPNAPVWRGESLTYKGVTAQFVSRFSRTQYALLVKGLSLTLSPDRSKAKEEAPEVLLKFVSLMNGESNEGR
jgi:hypothetical protein